MRAVRIHRPGGPEVLQVDELEVTDPGAGEIRVRIEVAGVNFIDTYYRTGVYPLEFPATIGVEAGGVVDAVGREVSSVSEGDRVAYTGQQGGYAELQVVPADAVVPIPSGIDTSVAVAALLQGMTAHFLTHDTYPVRSDTVALVHAAAGGVGHLLTQVCKLLGARVIATCGTREKADLVRNLGADEVVIYTEDSFIEATRRFTEGRGVDVVFDGVGKSTFQDSLTCLRRRGMMVLYGQASGAVDPVDPQRLNRLGSLFLTRPSLFHHIAERDELGRRAADLFGWIDNGDIDVWIDRSFRLDEAADAHRYIEGRNTRGKILLIP